ncbi:MAG: hypothetical protein WC842_00820 [Candidatus Paceibacterota bacterium]|jgi:hypothetical protein
MRKINIKKLQNNGSTSIIGTFSLDHNGVVSYVGNETFWENVQLEGVYTVKNGEARTFFPKDGSAFFDNLKYHFKSAYLFAEEEQEK